MSQNTQTRTSITGNRRKKLVSLTMGLLIFEPAAPALANVGAASPWTSAQNQLQATHMHAAAAATNNGAWTPQSTAGRNFGNAGTDIGKSQGSLPLLPHAMLLRQNLQTQTNTPAFVTPHANSATTEVGQSGQNLSLDLTSATANIILGTRLFNGHASVAITADGAAETFGPGAKVTAAQYVAIQQMLSTGKQEIVLNATGAASGGDFSLNAVGKNTVSLVVPTSVTAIDTVTRSGNIQLSGDLTNYGSISAVVANPHIVSSTISAYDINNESGATISATAANPAFNLNLVAANNFSNSGTIKSTGDLTISTGSGNVVNTGSVSAGRNVNITSSNAAVDININATGGTFSAGGDINMRDKSYGGAANINLEGGDYLSKNLNMYSGSGAINGAVDDLTGKVNTVAGIEHISASTSNLILGNNKVDGDPTFVNQSGDITISGINTFTEDVAILASGNIKAGSNDAQIIANGHNVTLIAGTKGPTTPATTTTVPGTQILNGQTATADLSTVSLTGGSIDLSASKASNIIDTSSTTVNAGNVNLVALGTGASGGTILLNSASTINAQTGGAAAAGGSVTVIASGNPTSAGTTISLGSISTASTYANGGQVRIATVAPTSTTVSFDYQGKMTGSISPSSMSTTSLSNSGVELGTINTQGGGVGTGKVAGGNGGSVNILAGADIHAAGLIVSSGGKSDATPGNGGAVSIISTKGAIALDNGVQANGGLSTLGGASGNGAPITISAQGRIAINGGVISSGNSFGNVTISGRTLALTGFTTNIGGNTVTITTSGSYIDDAYFSQSDLSDNGYVQQVDITTGPISVSTGIVGNIFINGVSKGTVVTPGTYTGPGAAINLYESGSTYSVSSGTSVTAAEYIQLLQTSTGASQFLSINGSGPATGIANGGNFTIATANLPHDPYGFSSLVIPAGVTANVNVPLLATYSPLRVDGIMNLNSASTQVNVGGDVLVNGKINFNGAQGGSLVALGSITMSGLTLGTGNGSTINMVSSDGITINGPVGAAPGNRGNLNLVAGADIEFNGNNASFTGPSSDGGLIYLGGNVSTGGGNFTAVAYNDQTGQSTYPIGTIVVIGAVNTGSASAAYANGNVVMIAQQNQGIAIRGYGAITTSGVSTTGNGGSVTLLASIPAVNGGTATISAGQLTPASTFSTTPTDLLGGDIQIQGVTTAGTGGAGGNSPLSPTGGTNGGNGGAGGAVSILTYGNATVLGNIEAYGGGGGGAGSSANAGGSGGNGGSVSITGLASTYVGGDINSSGGGGGGGISSLAGLGGNAGNISLYSTNDTQITGVVLAAGGGSGNEWGGGGSFGGGGGGNNRNGYGTGGGGGTFGGGGAGYNGGGGGGGGFAGSGGGGAGSAGAGAGSGGGGGNGAAGSQSAGTGIGGSGFGGGGKGGAAASSGSNGGAGGTGSGAGGAGFNSASGAGGSSGTAQNAFGAGGSDSTGTFSAPSAGQGGNGGQVSIVGNNVTVIGVLAGGSTNFSGQSINAAGTGGSINIVNMATSIASGTLSANADYSSTTRSEAAPIVGGSNPFSVADKNATSGTAGTLAAGNITINGQTTNGSKQTITTSAIALNEQGGAYTIVEGTLLTPAESAAVIQLATSGSQGLILNGSGITGGAAVGGVLNFKQVYMPVGNIFTNLVLPANVRVNTPVSFIVNNDAQINGNIVTTNPSLTITVNGNATIAGSILFDSGGTLNANGGQLNLNSGSIGVYSSVGNLSISSTKETNLTGNANISGGILTFNASALNVGSGSAIAGTFDVILNTATIANDGKIQVIAYDPSQGYGQLLLYSPNSLTLSGAGQFTAPYLFSAIGVDSINLGNFFSASQLIPTNQIVLNTGGTLTIGVNSLTVTPDFTTGNGGSIQINASNLVKPAGPLALNAVGTGTGNGGTVTAQLSDSSDISVSNTGTFTVSAHAGSVSGAGGQVTITSGGGLTVDPAWIDLTPGVGGGIGGGYNLQATNKLTIIGNQLTANGTATGAGGNIFLGGDTIAWTGGGPLVLTANGDGFGRGGEVDFVISSKTAPATVLDSSGTAAAGSISIHASGGAGGTTVVYSNTDIQYNSIDVGPTNQTAGNGGSFDIEAGGKLSFATNSVHMDGLGDGTGGSIFFAGKTVALPTSANLNLTANAGTSGSGAGGTVSLYTYSVNPITVGTGNGQISLAANGGGDPGQAGENGGSVYVYTLGNLTVNANAISAAAGHEGSGGLINLRGGNKFENTPGNLVVIGNLAVNGTGATGVGGTVTLESNSKTAFSIGSAKATNGTQGNIDVSGPGGSGQISITNNGAGGITQVQALTGVDIVTLNTGAGPITLNNNIGSDVSQVNLNTTTGKITAASKAIIAPGILYASSTSGSISLPNLQSKIAKATTGGKGTVTITAPLNQALTFQGISGATATIKGAGDMTFVGTMSGGNITITNTNKNGGLVTLGAGITLTGTLSVTTAGSITDTSTIAATTAVKYAATGATSEITEQGTINTGAAGTVSMVVAKTQGLAIDTSGSSINAGKSITLTATKGSIKTGSIGNQMAPATVAVTAYNTITNNESISAISGVTEKTTGTIANGGISYNGNIFATLANKGTVSLSVANPTGVITGQNKADIGAGKSVTLAASKGAIDVYSIGQTLGAQPLTVSLSAANGITNDSDVSATTSITEKTTAAAASIQATGSLNANGPAGVITISHVGDATHAMTLSGDVNATKAVTLTSTKGSIVVSNVNTGVFKATALNNFFAMYKTAIVGSQGVTITTTSTKNDPTATPPNFPSIVVSSITTGTGPTTAGGAITIKAASGAIWVNGDATLHAESNKTTKATITIQNSQTTGIGGTISVAGGDVIETAGTLGGNINLVIGTVPGAPKVGTAPTDATYKVNGTVVVTPSSTGPFYFGSGTTGKINIVNPTSDPSLVLFQSEGGGKVIFNTGNLPAANITINAGSSSATPTTFTADPPAAPAAQTAPMITLPTINVDRATSNAINPGNLQPTVVSATLATISSSIQANGDSAASTIAATRTLYGTAANSDAPTETVYVGDTGARNFDIEAKVWGVGDGEQSEIINLTHGNAIVAPTSDTVVDTAFGQVVVKAGAVALVMAQPHGTAVYNLHDRHFNSVVLKAGGAQTTITPGRHVLVTARRNTNFDWVNSAESFAYRNVGSKPCGEGLQAFTAEFSLLHAIAYVRQLREMVNAKDAQSRQLTAQMLKTAAIINQLSASGEAFQMHRHPQMTASALNH